MPLVMRRQKPHRLTGARRDVYALPGQHERLQLVRHLQRPRVAQVLQSQHVCRHSQ